MADTGFCIDWINWRVVPDGPVSAVESCTHGGSLSEPCVDCEFVVGALASAVTAL